MSQNDYYALLGVAKNASADEIKKAYRKAAMQYHPDRNPGDKAAEQKFKDINAAYDVLRDDQKRAAYDRFGHAAFEQGGGHHGGGGFDFSSGFADIFDEIFGHARGRSNAHPARGSDLRYDMAISLEEAFAGKEAEISLTTSAHCEHCHGNGAEPGTNPISCTTCHGAGRVRAQQGFFTIERTCPSCDGTGQIIKNPCKSCRGSGRTRKQKTLKVSIPAGVEDGTRIRVSGEGEAGARGAPSGDLYLFLSVKGHPLFERDGSHIFCRVPIPMTTASLGGEIEVPAIDGGRVRVTIPAGTQTGSQFRLKGKGMSIMRSAARGDMFIQALVETPVNLSKRQEELLREFEQAGEGRKQSPESQGFFAKVRDFFEDLGIKD